MATGIPGVQGDQNDAQSITLGDMMSSGSERAADVVVYEEDHLRRR